MTEEMEKDDNIDIFNANFEYEGNDEEILDLYNLNENIENNDMISKKIIKRIYNHPLFLNYNYCLFCLERRKTKYNHRNLFDKHKLFQPKKISNFLEEKNIKLKNPEDKIDKLAKRRFIHSCEHIEKEIVDNNQFSGSDTELFIDEKENIILIKKNSKISEHKKNNSNIFSKTLTIDTNINSNNKIIKRYSSNKYNLFKINKTKYSAEKSIDKSEKILSNHNSINTNENPIFKRRKRSLKTTKKISKPLSFFGFIINPFKNNNQNETKDLFMEQTEEDKINNFQYFEKNEKCGICLGEIKDKFTLFCGDFFCRE